MIPVTNLPPQTKTSPKRLVLVVGIYVLLFFVLFFAAWIMKGRDKCNDYIIVAHVGASAFFLTGFLVAFEASRLLYQHRADVKLRAARARVDMKSRANSMDHLYHGHPSDAIEDPALDHQPDQQVHQPGQQVHQPGQQVHQPGQHVHQPDQHVHQPDQHVHQPGQQVPSPGQHLATDCLTDGLSVTAYWSIVGIGSLVILGVSLDGLFVSRSFMC